MKKTTGYRNRDRELEIKMTPMIDVVFLLLVFFVWTASFHIVENSLPTSLSSELGTAESTEITPQLDFDQIVIRISGNGQLELKIKNELNGAKIGDINELQNRLQEIARAKSDIKVIIHPEDEVPMGNVIDVFDIAQVSGFDQVMFTTPAAAP